MTDQGLVSVILPNRNHAHFLANALESLRAQTWRSLEILVVDDASSDASGDVVRSVAASDPRVRLLQLSAHHGINRAVQSGLAQVNGEYVYVAAADDFVEPRFIETCVEQLVRHPNAGLCFSDPSEYYPKNGKRIPYPLYLSETPVYFAANVMVALLARNYFHISGNTAIYRLASFRAAGGYIAELKWLSDWFVTLVVALRDGACYVPRQLTYVTIRGDSYSAVNLADARGQREVFRLLLLLLSRPEYADVAAHMRRAGILPEYHLRTIVWLLQTRAGREFMTGRLLTRIIKRAIWSYLRPYVPAQIRRGLRKIVSSTMRKISGPAT